YEPGGNRWAMTERGRGALDRNETVFRVGPSSMEWSQGMLVIDFDEVAVPRPPAQWLPRRISGRITLRPHFVTGKVFNIDSSGNHRWWPIAPSVDANVTFGHAMPGGPDWPDWPDWKGHGYIDCNWGTEPLEKGFRRWDWARGTFDDASSVILYDSHRRDGSHECLSILFDPSGRQSEFAPPQASPLKRGFWGVERHAHHDPDTVPASVEVLEDGPFYMRSVVSTRLQGKKVRLMHESLSGDRFANPVVKAMLPFRMPRRSR
ncbi:MAG: carotenoid 1,2-hydratase, partial [Nitratireductor sp.]|nr:carotenoid 1,2-hydratase [Nitratireductor sp.]